MTMNSCEKQVHNGVESLTVNMRDVESASLRLYSKAHVNKSSFDAYR